MSTKIVATAFGGPEVLSVVEVPLVEPGPGEVRVAVRAAGVNPIDFKTYGGYMNSDPATLPLDLGLEAAGVVSAVGPGVTTVTIGDEVIAYQTTGAYTTDLVTPAASVVAKPAGLGWAEAGGLMLTGATARHTLSTIKAAAGDTVLVHGGAGGVGLILVQLARRDGVRVIATASAANHDLLRSLGAEPVEYGDGLESRVRELAPHGVDAAADLVGTEEALQVSLALVADVARIATIANFSSAPAAGVTLVGGFDAEGVRIRNEARGELAALAGTGELVVQIAGTYPLEQAAEAHRVSMDGHTVGKLVLTV